MSVSRRLHQTPTHPSSRHGNAVASGVVGATRYPIPAPSLRPCCTSASSSGRTGGASRPSSNEDVPLIIPSLVIPPPSTGSQYGKNKVFDLPFSGWSGGGGSGSGGGGGGSEGGGGGGKGGRGGSGGGGTRGGGDRGGGNGNRSGGQGGFPGGGDRRFGALPRLLAAVQLLCWTSVLLTFARAVVKTCSQMANQAWYGGKAGLRGPGGPAHASQGGQQEGQQQEGPELGVGLQWQDGEEQQQGGEQGQHEAAPSLGQAAAAGEGVDAETEAAGTAGSFTTAPASSLTLPAATAAAAAAATGQAGAAADGLAAVGPASRSTECSTAEAGPGSSSTTVASEAASSQHDAVPVAAVLATEGAAQAGSIDAACCTSLAGSEGQLGSLNLTEPQQQSDTPQQQQQQSDTPQQQQQSDTPQQQQQPGRPPFVRYNGSSTVGYRTLALILSFGALGFFSSL